MYGSDYTFIGQHESKDLVMINAGVSRTTFSYIWGSVQLLQRPRGRVDNFIHFQFCWIVISKVGCSIVLIDY